MVKPSIPKGTRDFLPLVMARRNFIFDTLRKHFQSFGFESIETPSMENLDTLLGKYGEEGDRLIFKILERGDKLINSVVSIVQQTKLKEGGELNSGLGSELVNQLSDSALRYDLTVPFARFVVQHRNELTFPFRRYQIQPVWRADRPQRGRYREFFQCDADVVGTDSLFCEVELVQLYDRALSELNLPGFTIKINHRKILAGIAEVTGVAERLTDLTIAIDKLDKIGEEGVLNELRSKDFSEETLKKIAPLFAMQGDNESRLSQMREFLASSQTGLLGIKELEFVLKTASKAGLKRAKLEFDITLARGLNYYTGAIFEVKVHGVEMGSIGGGGRYDDLTGIFGMSGLSGVGISFGADRIYDVMETLDLFPEHARAGAQVLFANFGETEAQHCLRWLTLLRDRHVAAELYPDSAKMKKQFKYADDKGIAKMALIGDSEIAAGTISVKDLKTGEQKAYTEQEFLEEISSWHM